MVQLGRELCGLIAASLGLAPTYFDEALAEPNANVRMLHYPPQPPRSGRPLGCGAHTDWGFITILLQDDCGGLEIAVGETWLQADPIANALIVNLGDMVARMTAGAYASNVHRVVNSRSRRDRYSVATFFNPHALYQVACVPTCRPASGAPAPITFADHINDMLRRTYGP
jgi:isopenicillin N synthase-like dioxygenase